MQQRVVKAIAEGDGCAGLQQNDLYLDDGVLAGTISAVSVKSIGYHTKRGARSWLTCELTEM